MVSSLTPRAKYTLDAAGQIGVQHANWDRADEVAGIIYTTKAAGIPPVAKLHDGCVVSEKDTGISYKLLASENFAVKHYISYPFAFRARNAFDIGIGNSGYRGFDNVDTANCVNWDTTWQEAGTFALNVKVRGIYIVNLHSWWNRYAAHQWANGSYAQWVAINNTEEAIKENCQLTYVGYPNDVATLSTMFHQIWNVGDKIRSVFYNNSAAGLIAVTHVIEIVLLKPMD